MKISQIPSIAQSTEAQTAKTDSIRSLKMRVNQTPGLDLPPEAGVAETQENIDNVDDTNQNNKATLEATAPLSPQLAAIARQRRALQQERRAFEEEKRARDAASQGSDAIPMARLKSEPLKVLLESGVTYEQLTDALLANQGNPEIAALKAEIEALKTGVDQKLTDRDTQAKQQVLAEMRRHGEQLIASGDDFELVRETRSLPDVMRLIEKTYDETGEVLDVPVALKLVEDELFERNQSLMKLKKMQGLIQPQAQQLPQQRPGMRTLTNNHTASVPMDRRARALAAAYGTLKK